MVRPRSRVGAVQPRTAAMVIFGLLIAYQTGRHPANLDIEDTVASPPPPPPGVCAGPVADRRVLGAVFVSGEYATGMIRSSLVAAPRRTPVLLAKLVVFGAVALVIASLVAFLGGESVSDPSALRVTLGTGVYLTLIGLLGSAFGWLVRHTAGAISALLGLLLVAPAIFGNLLGNWGKDVAEFLPSAGESFSHSYTAPRTLAP